MKLLYSEARATESILRLSFYSILIALSSTPRGLFKHLIINDYRNSFISTSSFIVFNDKPNAENMQYTPENHSTALSLHLEGMPPSSVIHSAFVTDSQVTGVPITFLQ